ncbi:DUF2194 domain-containing protein [bacterium]|nr:DUF2194 domain-containing protein [bacterium]
MKVILRDDDTCYFTKPEELKKAFGKIWDFAPISVAVVPFVGGSLKSVVPKEYWGTNKLFPIGENKELVKFLKKLLREKKICIMLHGYSHQDYPKGPEFVAGENLYQKVKEGKEYLENLFETKITTFVPPHNSLSEKGWKAIVENGLNISGIHNFPRFTRLKHPYYWPIFLKKCLFKPFTGYTYPYPIDFRNHKEIPYLSFSEGLSLYKVKKILDSVYKKNGIFCLATHYLTLQNKNLRKKLEKIIKLASSHENVKFITFNEI